jgi:hypothetical protein
MSVPQVAPHHVQQWLKDGTDHEPPSRCSSRRAPGPEDGAHDIVHTLSAQKLASEAIVHLGRLSRLEETTSH